MRNKEIAEALYRISELLTLKNENVFKLRAYERASGIIAALPEPIEDISARGKLTEIPGIGRGIAEKVEEYLSAGKIAYLDELKASFPEGFFDLMEIPGMGPKKAKALFDRLKIKDIASLKTAALSGKIRGIEGFGSKSEENIIKGIALKDKFSERMLLSDAWYTAKELIEALSASKFITRISPAGSLRRRRETVRDIDILASVQKGKEEAVTDQFIKLPGVAKVNAKGPTKASVITGSGLQVDLRIVPETSFGAALQYFTGSKEHNISLRGLAKDKGLTVNEYGVFKARKTSGALASTTEEEVYKSLGLAYIPPELRENRGEIEAASKGRLPKLVELKDIKGDTHTHSEYSDGSDSLEEIAKKAKGLGYEWIVVTDHSQSLKVARGLSIPVLRKKIMEASKINASGIGIRLLCGSEVDILSDGSLDYPDEVLKDLDFVIASIHTGFTQSENQITARIIKAIENPYVNAIGHLTGRLLNEREPYAVDVERVIQAAKKNNKLLELNAYPNRLDLYDVYCRKAKELGVKICIGTDSHSIDQLGNMSFGVDTARRGWLEKKDILNTMTLEKLMKYLNRGKT